MGALITGDWQIQRAGYLLGDTTDYDIRKIDGLGQPAAVPSDKPLSQRHGAVAGKDFLGSRVVTVVFEVVDDSSYSMGEKLAVLAEAFAPTEEQKPTFMRIPGVGGGGVVELATHVRRRSVSVTTEYARGLATVAVQLSASDPRLYGYNQITGSASADDDSGLGLEFDVTPDIGFGGAVLPGLIETNNGGNFSAPLMFRVYGPVTNPVVTRVSDGAAMSFTTTVASGSYLEVNSESRTVKLNGVTNQYSTLDVGSTWLEVPAGDDQFRLTRTGTGSATLVVYYNDCYV